MKTPIHLSSTAGHPHEATGPTAMLRHEHEVILRALALFERIGRGPEAGGGREEVAQFGAPPPVVVFTGGDPLRRADVYSLVQSAAKRGLRVALTPSGTALVTEEKLLRLMEPRLGD